jgi:hypothetical protein
MSCWTAEPNRGLLPVEGICTALVFGAIGYLKSHSLAIISGGYVRLIWWGVEGRRKRQSRKEIALQSENQPRGEAAQEVSL